MYKKIKRILLLILAIIVGICVYNIISTNKQKEDKEQQIKMNEVNAEEKATDIYKRKNVLENTLNKSSKVILSEGNIKIKYLFSNEYNDVMDKDDANYLKVLHDKLFKQQIEYKTEYKYNYTYEIKNIDVKVEVINNKQTLVINLNTDQVRLESISEQLDKSKITEEYGWIATDFTPTEIKAIQKRMYFETYNYLITNADLKNKSIYNLKEAIKDICNKLQIKDYCINVYPNETITNQGKYTTVEDNKLEVNKSCFE